MPTKRTAPRKVMAIHDLSCAGRCSLTVAIPILSAAGITCCPLPTAVLSTHTGEFTGYTFHDLTEDMLPIVRHWQREHLRFCAVYSGYLGSPAQIGIVEEIFSFYRGKDCPVVVDPVMGDHGRLYTAYTPAMAEGMAKLCRQADCIIPNMTEAAFLTGRPYREGPYGEAEIASLLEALGKLGPRDVVLTGVSFRPQQNGIACYHRESGRIDCFATPHVPGIFYGTGDVFASVLVAALCSGREITAAA